MKSPTISLVVSMYNTKPATVELIEKLFLPSLINNCSPDKQVIILDDGSPLHLETQEMIEKFKPELTARLGDFVYVQNPANLGFARSYNKGMQLTDGDAIVIVNDDIYLPKNSLDNLAAVLQSNPQFGAVGPVTNLAASFQKTNLFAGIKDFCCEK